MTKWLELPISELEPFTGGTPIMSIQDGKSDYHFTLSGKLETAAYALDASIDQDEQGAYLDDDNPRCPDCGCRWAEVIDLDLVRCMDCGHTYPHTFKF